MRRHEEPNYHGRADMSGTVSKKTLTFSMLAAVVVGAVGHYIVAKSQEDTTVFTYPIELTPDNSGYTMEAEVKDNALKCKPNNNKGCVDFKENTVGFIKFYLPGSKWKNKRCKQNSNDMEVITKIELTTNGSGDKGVFNEDLPDPPLLAEWIKIDAFPGVDLTTGIVSSSV